ncbi:hypothetical protein BDN71DRAFT_454320 [Pleurotus eryngii]|uniref:Uncharacterized protein n=1 Tax=Pleurotus eryngii TaxID=5323 RepID=A0A9P5ZMG0_PLEER|nr:hypothetical protein BDN71DRAFT_454320 [Pleurotus eryngii]
MTKGDPAAYPPPPTRCSNSQRMIMKLFPKLNKQGRLEGETFDSDVLRLGPWSREDLASASISTKECLWMKGPGRTQVEEALKNFQSFCGTNTWFKAQRHFFLPTTKRPWEAAEQQLSITPSLVPNSKNRFRDSKISCHMACELLLARYGCSKKTKAIMTWGKHQANMPVVCLLINAFLLEYGSPTLDFG